MREGEGREGEGEGEGERGRGMGRKGLEVLDSASVTGIVYTELHNSRPDES